MHSHRSHLIPLILTLLCALPAGPGASPLIATCPGGPITLEEVEHHLLRRQSHLAGEIDPTTEAGRQILTEALAEVAYEKTLEAALGELPTAERTWLEEDLAQADRMAQVLAAENHFIRSRAQLPSEAMQALLEEHSRQTTLPAVASWRFILFVHESDVEPALRALESGTPFSEVAWRHGRIPRQGEPGQLIGPLAFEGQLLPAVEEAIRTLPLGEVSEPIETPSGPILLLVESRALERHPDWRTLRGTVGVQIIQERIAQLRSELMDELRSKWPVSLREALSGQDPPDTVAVRVASQELTVGEIRSRASQAASPEAALAELLSTQGLTQLAEEMLLLLELEASGLANQVDVIQLRERLVRERRLNHAEDLLWRRRMAEAPDSEGTLQDWLLAADALSLQIALEDLRWLDGHLAIQERP